MRILFKLFCLLIFMTSCEEGDALKVTTNLVFGPDTNTNAAPKFCDKIDSTSTLEVIWIDQDIRETPRENVSGLVLQNGNLIADINKNLVCYSGENGSIQWESRYLENIPSYEKIENILSFENHVFTQHGDNVYKVNPLNGNRAWTNQLNRDNNSISNYKDILFGVENEDEMTSKILMANPVTGKWSEQITLGSPSYSQNIQTPNVFINSFGDTLLIFQNQRTRLTGNINNSRFDIYAYNMSQDSVQWKLTNFKLSNNAKQQHPPIVKDNYIYFVGSDYVFCIYAPVGAIIWQKSIEQIGYYGSSIQSQPETLSSNYIVQDDKLIFSTGHILIALNKSTGNEIWRNDLVKLAGNFQVSKDRIYFMENKELYTLDINTGMIIDKLESPFECGPFYEHIIIDEERERMFAFTNRGAVCMKLPK